MRIQQIEILRIVKKNGRDSDRTSFTKLGKGAKLFLWPRLFIIFFYRRTLTKTAKNDDCFARPK